MIKYFKKQYWNLQRFGFSPNKIKYRLVDTNNNAPKILIITIPKSGTHLLERALCLYPSLYRIVVPTIHEGNRQKYDIIQLIQHLKGGQILVSHLHFSQEDAALLQTLNISPIFMIRDPRDILISNAFYVSRTQQHRLHLLISEIGDFDDKLKIFITGSEKLNIMSIRQELEKFSGWLNNSIYIVKFEDIIGRVGGESQVRQKETLVNLYKYLKIDLSPNDIQILCNNLISNASPTFRKGTTQQWKEYFDPEIKQLFKDVAGDLLIRYGYEKDMDW